ncbi:unnamed protein product [Plasmodium vivax]|uniref:(malaria parasite P. vivax) hypothetical protein n=1 Tax=Plasmodium vivax TaxID=5855 RepID=A0A8S4HDK7_PLAVI|nr:unnamed protein product [Plasmodium vivax]
MPTKATDKSLLTYDEYHDFVKRFKNPYNKDADGLNQEKFLRDTKVIVKNRSRLEPVLEKLLDYIRNNGIFYGDDRKPCSYVSYILSKEVETNGYAYETEIFNMFKEFLYKYNHRHNFTASICSNTLLLVDSDMYNKMNKLYELYDRYEDHRKNNFLGEWNSCQVFIPLLRQYNDFIKLYQPTNKDYEKILKHFEKKIKERVASYNLHACPLTIFYVREVKLIEDEKPKELVQVQQKRINTVYQVSQARSPPSHEEHQASHPKVQTFRAESQTPRLEFQTTRAEVQSHHADSKTAHEHPQTYDKGNQSSQGTLEHSAQHALQQEVRVLPPEETPKRELDIYLSPEYQPHYRPYEFPGTSSYLEPNPHTSVPPSSNEAGDTSSSVMNTITSALRDVEPGPVLGVSGGMGVLFLLFKYTPVGSFFGGRRGRFRQIPSSFRGFPPGEFSNFQEYEGGYIGYGPMNINPLAE